MTARTQKKGDGFGAPTAADLVVAADKAIQARRKFGDRSVQYTLALIELRRVKRRMEIERGNREGNR